MLTFADLNFSVRFEGSGRLPAYRGTTLRGALGYALKDTVCHIYHRECHRCILRSQCAFPAIFEGVPSPDRTIMRKYPFIPQPMVLRVSLGEKRDVSEGELYKFGIRLFGPAIDFYPYVIVAVSQLCRKGLGQDRIPMAIESVDDGFESVYQSIAEHELQAPTRRTIDFPKQANDCSAVLKLNIETPARIRTNGQLNSQLSAEALVKAAVRRLRVMSHFYGDREIVPEDFGNLIDASKRAKIMQKDLRWHQIPRKSKRQGVDMVLDGVVGQIWFEAPDPSFIRWVAGAQECHIGKATSFGFGRYSCEVTN